MSKARPLSATLFAIYLIDFGKVLIKVVVGKKIMPTTWYYWRETKVIYQIMITLKSYLERKKLNIKTNKSKTMIFRKGVGRRIHIDLEIRQDKIEQI